MSHSRYQYHPEFLQGKFDHGDGIRRGQNPYSGGGDDHDQIACHAWWAGWDEAEQEEDLQDEQLGE